MFLCAALSDHTLGRNNIGAGNKTLLTFPRLLKSVGCFFVNFPAMADGENPDHSGFAIHLISNAKPPDSDAQQSSQLPGKRCSTGAGDWTYSG
jgi:hypothetical protein